MSFSHQWKTTCHWAKENEKHGGYQLDFKINEPILIGAEHLPVFISIEKNCHAPRVSLMSIFMQVSAILKNSLWQPNSYNLAPALVVICGRKNKYQLTPKSLNKGGEFLKKLSCCVGGEYYKIIWFIN